MNAIYLANLSNPEQKALLVHTNLTLPKSLAVYPEEGYMFWSNWAKDTNADGNVEQAWMDGSHRMVVASKLHWPMGLTIDRVNGFLYFCDALSFTIFRVEIQKNYKDASIEVRITIKIIFRGMNFNVIHFNFDSQTVYKAHSHLLHKQPVSMAFYNQSLFVSVSGEVLKMPISSSEIMNPNSTGNFTSVFHGDVYMITVYEQKRQDGQLNL